MNQDKLFEIISQEREKQIRDYVANPEINGPLFGPATRQLLETVDALREQLRLYEHETETVKELRAERDRYRKALEKIIYPIYCQYCDEGHNDAPCSCYDFPLYLEIARKALGKE